jgi:hypothetical protein
MKRQIGLATATAAFLAASLAAQTPPPTSAQSPQSRPNASPDSVTVTGCVQAPSTSSATSSPAGAAATPSYILADATIGSDRPTSTGTSGTAATAPGSSSSMKPSYTLDGSDSDLKKHVGHKVEVTGTIDSASAGNRPTSTTGTAAQASNAPRLKVASIKMIAADCSAK